VSSRTCDKARRCRGGCGVAVRVCVCDLQDVVTRRFIVASNVFRGNLPICNVGGNVIYPFFIPTHVRFCLVVG
jgi:hypothetical protein